MTNSPIEQYLAAFEGIKETDAEGNEFWSARQLARVLEYSQYRHFLPVLYKAREACENSGHALEDHVEDILTLVDIGSGAKREIDDFKLSHFFCYLVIQNADFAKPMVRVGVHYFAINPIQINHTQDHQTFEFIKQFDKSGNEFWSARQLHKVLEYSEYRHFLPVIEKAREACKQSGYHVEDHFEDILEMVPIGSGAKRELEDVRLSRYACYLVVQNGDPSKPVIANGQTYFAMQTRRQEIQDEAKFAQLSENEKRLAIRNELAEHNKFLAAAAKQAGVETPLDYAIFQDHGYRGLYGGLGAKEIHARKGLKKSQKILDHMGSTELAANLFRATQAEEKLKRDNVSTKRQANQTHLEVGKKVRDTIKELGGTMPEALPTPEQSIKQIESAKLKLEKKK